MPAGGDGQRKPNFEPMKINTQMAKEVRTKRFGFARFRHRFRQGAFGTYKKIRGGGESKIRWGWLEYTFAGIFFSRIQTGVFMVWVLCAFLKTGGEWGV